MTYREVVSRIENTLNSVNKDGYIPRRYILSVFKSKGTFLMSQKLHDKSLYRETSLFKWINCVQLVEEDSIKCDKIELKRCESLMRTSKKLPELVWSKYGPSIIMITNIDGSREYKLIDSKVYSLLKKRKGFEQFKGKYAVIYPDNYLYIPDSKIKAINIMVLSLDEKLDDASECEGCNKDCKNYWDTEVTISDKLLEVVISETLKEIVMRLQIPRDENPNLDSNEKSRVVG